MFNSIAPRIGWGHKGVSNFYKGFMHINLLKSSQKLIGEKCLNQCGSTLSVYSSLFKSLYLGVEGVATMGGGVKL